MKKGLAFVGICIITFLFSCGGEEVSNGTHHNGQGEELPYEGLMICCPQKIYLDVSENSLIYYKVTRARYRSGGYYSNGKIINTKVDDIYGNELMEPYSVNSKNAVDYYFSSDHLMFGQLPGFVEGYSEFESSIDNTYKIYYCPEDEIWSDYILVQFQHDGENTEIIDNNNNRHYHQRYNEYGDLQGQEIPGDGLDDNDYYNSYFSNSLDPNKKDIILEIDVLQETAQELNTTDINNRIIGIFGEIDINVIVLWEYLSDGCFDDLGDNLNFAEAINLLSTSRNPGLDRKAIHIIVSEIGPGDGLHYNASDLYGINVTLFGHQDDNQDDVLSENFYRLYKNQAELDKVGIYIFYRNFDESDERHFTWSITDAFSYFVAHEVGHTLGISKPESFPGGNIMSHALNIASEPMTDYWMHFDYRNYQDNSHDDDDLDANYNCICTRDVLGVHTINLISGWSL